METKRREVKSYVHDSNPAIYTGMGEDYEVLPGNVRTTRHRLCLELDFNPQELELAQRLLGRFDDLIAEAKREAKSG